MISNAENIIVYHKTTENHEDILTPYVYKDVWIFKAKGAKVKEGFENSNKMSIRIPYISNLSANIDHFSVGDVIIKFKKPLTVAQVHNLTVKERHKMRVYRFSEKSMLEGNINLLDQNLYGLYDTYYITSITNNDFGTQKHIHLEAK